MFGVKAILVGALAILAAAQSSTLSFTHVPNPITDGKAQTITFSTTDTSSPVTILLRKGPASDLKTIDTLTSNASGGKFVWTPSTSLANGDNYALEIKQGTQVNYFGPFTIQGGSASAAASASASASGSASMSKNATMTASASSSMITSSRNGTWTTMPSTRNSTMNGTIPATLTTPKTVVPITSSGSPSSASSAGNSPSSASVSASSVPTTNGAATLYSSGVLALGAIAAFAALL